MISILSKFSGRMLTEFATSSGKLTTFPLIPNWRSQLSFLICINGHRREIILTSSRDKFARTLGIGESLYVVKQKVGSLLFRNLLVQAKQS